MNKILLFLLLLLIGNLDVFSQTWRRIGSWGNELMDIEWVSEEVGYITGDKIILKTIDGGLSWVEQEAPSDHLMLALDFYDEENGLMVGKEGMVYRTTDGGKGWKPIQLDSAVDLKSIAYLNQSEIFITGTEGFLFKSTDAGHTWSRVLLPSKSDMNSIFFINADSGFMATSKGEIIKTVDGGANWTLSPSGYEAPLNDIVFLNDTVAYAVGGQGTIIKTENAGKEWNFINSGTDTDFTQVAFNKSDPLIGLVTGKNGTLLRTVNGGLTFVAVGSRTKQSINGISFRKNSNVVYAVAGSGVAISSANSGNSWSIRFSGRADNYTDVQFLTGSRGYLIGRDGLILLTADGGISFTVRTRPLSLPFNTVCFLTNAAGYVSGNNGNIISTSNSGGVWTALNPGTSRDVYGMYFFNFNEGYVVGSKGYLAKTENRGVNWQTLSRGEGSSDYRDISFFKDRTGLIVGDEGWISRSEDGQVWNKIAISTSEDLNAIEILDDSLAVVVGKKGTILKTGNRGLTWKKINVPFDQHINDVEFLDESIGFVVGDKGLILKTEDGGENWEKVATATFQNFTAISFGDSNTGYAVGENGTFFNYSCQIPEKPATIFGESNICLSQQIYAVQESKEPGVSYDWRVDGGTIREGQGTSRVVVQWEIPGRNAIMVRGQNNCGNGSPSALEVVVSTKPERINEIQGNGAVCLDSFEDYQVDSLPGMNYLWEAKGGIIRSGQGTSKVTVEWTNLNQQAIKVSAKNPCGSADPFEKTILVLTSPSRPSEIEGPSLVGVEEADYKIGADPEVNYQWEIGEGGTIISGQGSGSIRVNWEKEGDFNLKVTPMNSCDKGESRTMAVKVNLITGIYEESYEPLFTIYPNPSIGDIHIMAKNIPEIREINIYNLLGQQISHTSIPNGVFEFHIRKLPEGIHTVVLKSRTKEFVRMILVQ